jgi:beta-phosphoglucomutase-like phosphatase (HAD superfamily)
MMLPSAVNGSPVSWPYDAADFDALVFDLDGTLANSLPGHLQAWDVALAPHGMVFPREHVGRWGGMPTRQLARIILELGGVPDAPAALCDEIAKVKGDAYRRYVHLVQAIPATLALVQEWHGRKPMAIATGSRRELASLTLQHSGLAPYFLPFAERVVTACDVPRAKPSPDTFMRAATLLGVDPRRCLAFEDGEAGMEAARVAGMTVVDVRPIVGVAV